jgi:hypothetical protein
MRTGHLPFRVSRKYWKATSHNPLVVNPITIDAVIIAYITDACVLLYSLMVAGCVIPELFRVS